MKIRFSVLAASLVTALVVTWASTATAQVPWSITHQGVIVDDAGEPVTGDHDLTFTLYDSETGGAIVWQESVTATLSDSGYFSVLLGGTSNPMDPAIFTGEPRWLTMAVDNETEMAPRLEITSVPYAVRAGRASEVEPGGVTTQALATDSVTSDKVSSLSWDKLIDLPAGLDDGDDDTLGGLICQSGQVPEWNGANWICGTVGTTYDGTDFAVSGQGCNTGDVVNGIDTNGNVNCVADQVNTYDGTDFAISSQSCSVGDVVTGVDANGNVACTTVQDSLYVDGGVANAIVTTITVSARSDCGSLTPVPHMDVYANGLLIGGSDVSNSSFADFAYNLPSPTYVDRIDVAFTNNGNSPPSGCDRNIYVEHIRTDTGITIDSTDTARVLYDRGAPLAGASPSYTWFDHADIVGGQISMPWNGALRFALAPRGSNLCPRGWWSVAGGRLCVEQTLQAADTMINAIANCRTKQAHVCTHVDLHQACGAGVNPFQGSATGWFGDHGHIGGGNVDDEYLTWNRDVCVTNNDGPSAVSSTTLPFRCCQ